MNLKDLQTHALKIANSYQELNMKNKGKSWTETDYMSGFVGDVGDLSKIVMAKNGLRQMDSIDAKLAHELSDCLWSILVLSANYKVDLEKEFLKTMEELAVRIKKQI